MKSIGERPASALALDGSLNPMTAFMSGKTEVNSDMNVALKLPQIMG